MQLSGGPVIFDGARDLVTCNLAIISGAFGREVEGGGEGLGKGAILSRLLVEECGGICDRLGMEDSEGGSEKLGLRWWMEGGGWQGSHFLGRISVSGVREGCPRVVLWVLVRGDAWQ